MLDAMETKNVDLAICDSNIVKYKESYNVRNYNIDFPTGYFHDDMAFIMQYICCAKSLYAVDLNLYNYVLCCNSIMDKTYFSEEDRIINPITDLMQLNIFISN